MLTPFPTSVNQSLHRNPSREAGFVQSRVPLLIVALTIIASSIGAIGQSSRRERSTAGTIQDVHAIAFSPDGRSLAIGRGSIHYTQRYGQIDLWDLENGQLRRVIRGFDGPVNSLSYSPDSRTLVSGSSEYRDGKGGPKKGKLYSEIKWWDAQTGDLKLKKSDPTDTIRTRFAAHSPDGKLLATVDYYTIHYHIDRSRAFGVDMRLLDANAGEPKVKVGDKLPQSFTSGFFMSGGVFSPAGDMIAAGTPGEVRIWNTRTGETLRKLKDFKGRVSAIAFSLDGRVLAVGSVELDYRESGRRLFYSHKSELNFFDLQTGELLRTLKGPGAAISFLAFSSDGKGLLIGSRQFARSQSPGRLGYLDFQTGVYSSILNKPSHAVPFVLSRNRRLVAFITDPTSVVVWDLRSRKARYTFDAIWEGENRIANRLVVNISRVLSVAFSPDGNTVAGGTEEKEIKLWDPRTGGVRQKLLGHQLPVSSVSISADGKILASASNDNSVHVWDLPAATRKSVITNGAMKFQSSLLSPDGKTIASARGNDILLFNAETGALFRKLSGHRSTVNSLAFTDDGRTLVSGSDDGTARVWDFVRGNERKLLDADEHRVTTISVDPNGRFVAGATDDFAVIIWDLESGAVLQRLKKHEDSINAIAFSRDGRWMSTGSDDRRLVIWDAVTWKSRHTINAEDFPVTSVAFSPDGRWLASGSGNASAVLWNVETGKMERILR